MDTSAALPQNAVQVHTDATGVTLATVPGSPATLPTFRPNPRGGLILLGSEAGVTLTAPRVMARLRGGSVFYDMGGVIESGGDVTIAAGQGVVVPVRDLLSWADALWIKTATIAGAGNLDVVYIPLETASQ